MDYHKRKKAGMVTINPLSLKPPQKTVWAICGWTLLMNPKSDLQYCTKGWVLKGMKRWRRVRFYCAKLIFSTFSTETRPQNGCI